MKTYRLVGAIYGATGCICLVFGDHAIAGFFLLISNLWFISNRFVKDEKND